MQLLEGEYFMSGNVACAEGAIAAGCRFFAGYPITPSSEIMHRMAERLPQIDGVFIQMEDELASMAAIIGASCAGVKAMTATSGPGFSLMMENIGLASMMEVPCVIVNVMRGGPSTGLPTLVGQADVMQARWGSHGDYELISITPSYVQEMYDLTIKAFNLSEKYRVPVIILSDEVVGHLTERIVIPKRETIKLEERKKPVSREGYLPFLPKEDLVPEMASAGEGFHVHMTGLTHDERGYPITTGEEAPIVQEKLVRRLVEKMRKNAKDIVDYEELYTEDAETVIIAYGISGRVAKDAVFELREKGIRAGLLRPIVIWPFPEERVRELAERIDNFLVVEINAGQIFYEVERIVRGKNTFLLSKLGGEIHSPEEIIAKVEEIL